MIHISEYFRGWTFGRLKQYAEETGDPEAIAILEAIDKPSSIVLEAARKNLHNLKDILELLEERIDEVPIDDFDEKLFPILNEAIRRVNDLTLDD